jgi:adenylosuccinate synthase
VSGDDAATPMPVVGGVHAALRSSHVPVTVMVGAQWGDEGKGKFTDLLAKEFSYVVRYQGGHNAGHTLVVDDQRYALRLVPSGVLYGHTVPVIANGVVVDLEALAAEVSMLEGRGVDCSRLRVSGACHLILPWHRALDAAREAALGDAKLGTTLNGIGPAYADKAARQGVRLQDVLDPVRLRQRLTVTARDMAVLLGDSMESLDDVIDRLATFRPLVARYITDTVGLLRDALASDAHVLCEGAQATFLDVDHGTYPFVTSSNPTAGGACVGTGIGPRHIDRVIGVAKAYVTRVGSGPFPSELHDDVGELLVERGHEFGTVTGRRRRPGWLDTVMLRHAVHVNSMSDLAVAKLDILDTLDEVKICTAYEIDGRVTKDFPERDRDFAVARPVYETLPGWRAPLDQLGDGEPLPVEATAFLARVEAEVGVPVSLVGVGPGRTQVRDHASAVR